MYMIKIQVILFTFLLTMKGNPYAEKVNQLERIR